MEATDRVVGIDLAKRSYVAQAIDSKTPKTEIWEGKTDVVGVDRLCGKLRPVDRAGLACCGLAFRLAVVIQERVGSRVVVLDAGALALIYKSVKKTDLADAGKLAWRLSASCRRLAHRGTAKSPQEEHRRALVLKLLSIPVVGPVAASAKLAKLLTLSA